MNDDAFSLRHLGNRSSFVSSYDAGLLERIPRKKIRQVLGGGSSQEINGFDRWVCYEVSALDRVCKPFFCVLMFDVPVSSSYIVESKSLKLYLQSLNFHCVDGVSDLIDMINCDLSACLDVDIRCSVVDGLDKGGRALENRVCLDSCIDGFVSRSTVDVSLLSLKSSDVVSASYYTKLFRSLCPVTHQPDWATVMVSFTGKNVSMSSLLSYMCSYRETASFHESCVERMFVDISQFTKASSCIIYASFLRRGGISIIPFRSFFDTPSHLCFDFL